MWGLGPWGGYGATPLPERFQRLWDQVKHVVRGGFPYSEGIYEDANKVVELGFYWNPDTTAEESLREYIGYEFPGANVDDVLEMIRGIERNHSTVFEGSAPDLGLAERALEIARSVDASLIPFAKGSWRWRQLYLRAVIDWERYAAAVAAGWEGNAHWGALVADNERAQAAFRELMDIYHCHDTIDEAHPQHAWVRPQIAQPEWT